MLCWAATIHKYQGRSLDQLVIGGFSSRWTQGMLYTALTRCRTAEGLFLLEFQTNALKANIDGLNEIKRIRKHSLVDGANDRLDFFNKYPPKKWNYICLQNVRSLKMHKEDVLSDPIINSADMVCLTETGLDDSNWADWKDFSNFDVYHKSRSECLHTEENDGRKSGGVAVLVNKRISSAHVDVLENKSLEMISVVTEKLDQEIWYSGIYRDHKMTKQVFLAHIETVFESHRTIPSVILGDFNSYDENNMFNSQLNALANKYGFIETVRQGTTVNDHLLDQIYVTDTKQYDLMKMVVLPSYFSDHNLVILCLKN